MKHLSSYTPNHLPKEEARVGEVSGNLAVLQPWEGPPGKGDGGSLEHQQVFWALPLSTPRMQPLLPFAASSQSKPLPALQ